MKACPLCGSTEFIEHALRYTTQPLTVDNNGYVDYEDFDYGDDVRPSHWDCAEGACSFTCDATMEVFLAQLVDEAKP